MNEELTLAIDELRQRPTDRGWFLPVKLAPCEVPDRGIGGAETLRDIQFMTLYDDWKKGVNSIARAVGPIIPREKAQQKLQKIGQDAIRETIHKLFFRDENTWFGVYTLAEKIKKEFNAFGEFAIPYLIEALEDKHPTMRLGGGWDAHPHTETGSASRRGAMTDV
jgi:hypothetical protein